MIQRITDLWPNLIRRLGAGHNEENAALNSQDSDDENENAYLEVDETTILEYYRTLSWTRLITISD